MIYIDIYRYTYIYIGHTLYEYDSEEKHFHFISNIGIVYNNNNPISTPSPCHMLPCRNTSLNRVNKVGVQTVQWKKTDYTSFHTR